MYVLVWQQVSSGHGGCVGSAYFPTDAETEYRLGSGINRSLVRLEELPRGWRRGGREPTLSVNAGKQGCVIYVNAGLQGFGPKEDVDWHFLDTMVDYQVLRQASISVCHNCYGWHDCVSSC
jgi:hypothetical protein